MPIYVVQKKFTAYLTVECDDLSEALAWEERIVATLEDEDGNPISADTINDFVVFSSSEEIQVRLVDQYSERES